MFQQLDDAKPKPSVWLVRAGLILGAVLLVLGIQAQRGHRDYAVVWLVIGVGWLFISGLGWLRLRKSQR